MEETAEEKTEEKKPFSFKEFFKKQIWPFVWILAVFGSARSSIADWNDVPTGSMNPTIIDGDRIFVNKLAYGLRVPFTNWWVSKWSAPKRGDIVIFPSPRDGTRLVKRVIGLPGDTIEVKDDMLILNGKPLNYGSGESEWANDLPNPMKAHRILFRKESLGETVHAIMILMDVRTASSSSSFDGSRRDMPAVTVPAGKYLMMGDNRDNSADSRYWGPIDWGFVDGNEIVGKAMGVAFSLNYNGYYLPRLDRFFKGLN